MSKAVLVMDMPSSCNKCNLRGQNYGLENVCFGRVEHSKKYGDYYKDIQNIETRPDWCPLRELPKKKEADIYTTAYDKATMIGYNACIDELLGGEHGK